MVRRRLENAQAGNVAEHEVVRLAVQWGVGEVARGADRHEALVAVAIVSDDPRVGEMFGVRSATVEAKPAFRFVAGAPDSNEMTAPSLPWNAATPLTSTEPAHATRDPGSPPSSAKVASAIQ